MAVLDGVSWWNEEYGTNLVRTESGDGEKRTSLVGPWSSVQGPELFKYLVTDYQM